MDNWQGFFTQQKFYKHLHPTLQNILGEKITGEKDDQQKNDKLLIPNT